MGALQSDMLILIWNIKTTLNFIKRWRVVFYLLSIIWR